MSSLTDLSGNSNTLVLDTGSNPATFVNDALNGRPGIHFNGVGNVMKLQSPISLSTFTVFTVFRCTTTNGMVYEHGFGAADNCYLYTTNSATIATARSNVTSARASSANWGIDGTNRIVRHEFDGTHASQDMCVNGTRLGLPTFSGLNGDPGTATTPAFVFSVGGRTGGTIPFNGHLMELIVFSPRLSEYDAQRLERFYLGPRYGITVA